MSRSFAEHDAPVRQPIIPLLIAFAIGISIDRYASLAWNLLLSGFLIGLIAWWLFYRAGRLGIASLALFAAGIAIAALWHHVWWTVYPADDISSFARELAEPQRLRATVVREPRWIPAPPPDPFDATPSGIRSVMTIRVDAIQQGNRWATASGDVESFVDGQLSGFSVGDRVELVGWLALQPPSHNPGEFDLNEFCRSERQLCSLAVLNPDAVMLIERTHQPMVAWVFSHLRQHLDQLIWQRLPPDNAALGSGILLGIREPLDDAEKTNYLMSGTIHLLAISGLHVGILAGGVLALGSLGIVSRRTSLWLTIVFVVFYALLVEFQAPVTRAAVLVVIWCVSKLGGRAGFSFNSLAAAACIVLMSNPRQLFQVGAQLSFLAVATMTATYHYLDRSSPPDPLDQLIEQTRPRFVRMVRAAGPTCLKLVAMSGLIWLVAVPLVAYRFHIVTPIALLVNPILMIPVTVALLSGFVFLLLGWWMPLAGALVGFVFDWSLSSIRWIVGRASEIPGAYWWTPGPSLQFVVAFALVTMLLFALPRTRMPARWSVSLSILALALGWLLPSAMELKRQEQEPNVEMVFADVGHGGCALLKLPGGKHVLFDAGSTNSPGSTARTIARMLWKERVYHLDAIVISHADLDHYNAVDRLTEFFSIGAVYAPEKMVLQVDPPAGELLRRLRVRQIPIRVAAAGQAFVSPNGCEFSILHPPRGKQFSNDNAGSIVCALTIAGHNVLLTGDVELEGLEVLLAQPTRRRLLAVAPHHGSKNSDPVRFMAWCAADNIVICDHWKPSSEQNLTPFATPGTHVFLTGRDGSVRLHIAERGSPVEIRSWTARPWN